MNRLPKDFLDRNLDGSDIRLYDGWRVAADFYALVYQAACQNGQSLSPGVNFKAEHICGPNFWVPLPPTLARLAGRCFYDMVKRRVVPFTVGSGKGVTLRYRRT